MEYNIERIISQYLQAEIHQINEETKDDVSVWAKNAKSLQEDIIRSKAMANDISRQSEAPDVSGETISDAEEKVQFINREVQYSQQLHEVLRGIQGVNGLLNQAEQALADKRILDSLRFLEGKVSWSINIWFPPLTGQNRGRRWIKSVLPSRAA